MIAYYGYQKATWFICYIPKKIRGFYVFLVESYVCFKETKSLWPLVLHGRVEFANSLNHAMKL